MVFSAYPSEQRVSFSAQVWWKFHFLFDYSFLKLLSISMCERWLQMVKKKNNDDKQLNFASKGSSVGQKAQALVCDNESTKSSIGFQALHCIQSHQTKNKCLALKTRLNLYWVIEIPMLLILRTTRGSHTWPLSISYKRTPTLHQSASLL